MGRSETIRWGIVGTGGVARGFAEGLKLAPGARLAGVVSRRMETAQQFAAAYGEGSARCYDRLDSLAGDADIDIVYIATPNHRHHEDCLACLEAGKNVVCEKPFALNAAQAREMIDSARRKRVFCMEAMWMRFLPLVRRARTLLQDGAIGPAQVLTADFAMPASQDPRSRWMDPNQGGGALLDRGVYCLSLAFYLLGRPDEVLSTATMTSTGVDGHSEYLLRFPSGACAVLWSSIRTRGSNAARIMGAGGSLQLHEPFYRPHRLTLSRFAPPATAALPPPAVPGWPQRLKASRLVQQIGRRIQPLLRRPAMDVVEPVEGTGYQYEAIEAMRCLREGALESPLMPLDETLKIMELMDRIRTQWTAT